jgi:hypothetical protein
MPLSEGERSFHVLLLDSASPEPLAFSTIKRLASQSPSASTTPSTSCCGLVSRTTSGNRFDQRPSFATVVAADSNEGLQYPQSQIRRVWSRTGSAVGGRWLTRQGGFNGVENTQATMPVSKTCGDGLCEVERQAVVGWPALRDAVEGSSSTMLGSFQKCGAKAC